jgi:hypothetical protein
VLATLRRTAARLRADLAAMTAADNPTLAEVRRDPTLILTRAGMIPDVWQRGLLTRPSRRTLLLCSRQAGKSTVSAALALRAALLEAPALVLLLSPSLRQSAELLSKVAELYNALGRPVPTVRPRDNTLKIELANGSRVLSLPGQEGTVRGYSSARLLVVDEAARVPDALYRSIRPMLAVSGGSLIGLSSAYAKQGWLFEEWVSDRPWNRVRVTADQVSRISPAFLEEEREALGERWWLMEYFCVFGDAIDAVFREEDVRAALSDDLEPLYPGA